LRLQRELFGKARTLGVDTEEEVERLVFEDR
jgi:hypothetical protein